MEMIFNELSIYPFSNSEFEANTKMEKFASTVATARKKGFRNIRSYHDTSQIILSENYSLHQWIHSKNVERNLKDLLYGMIIQPFIAEHDTSVEEKYINAEYYFEDVENDIKKTECVGLAAAYLYDTLSISLSSSLIWDNHKLPIIIETEICSKTNEVYNVSLPETFEFDQIKTLIENSGVLNLVKTELEPNEKKIHLADHHGKSELQTLSNRLKVNPYIVEMRSTNWGGNNFIRSITSDGVIEIVLVNSQRNYALWVQTTGRNIRETKAIAKIIEEKYS